MTHFIAVTDHKTDKVFNICTDKIVRISGEEPTEVLLVTGEILKVSENFKRIEGKIRSRVAKDDILFAEARTNQQRQLGSREALIKG